MEASKSLLCTMLLLGLLFNTMDSVESYCTVKNSSSNDLLILPVVDALVIIKVKVGAIVQIPAIYHDVIIKNLGTGKKSSVVKLVDGTVLVCVNGIVKGTVAVYLGGLINGIISILLGSSPILVL